MPCVRRGCCCCLSLNMLACWAAQLCCHMLLKSTSIAPSLPTALQAGCVPILHMRGFQKGGQLSADLVTDIQGRHSA